MNVFFPSVTEIPSQKMCENSDKCEKVFGVTEAHLRVSCWSVEERMQRRDRS
jgi:hypothetical protein